MCTLGGSQLNSAPLNSSHPRTTHYIDLYLKKIGRVRPNQENTVYTIHIYIHIYIYIYIYICIYLPTRKSSLNFTQILCMFLICSLVLFTRCTYEND